MAGFVPSSDLIAPVAAGEIWAVARLISRAEAGLPEARNAMGEIYRQAGRAHIIGITGVPGSGKSTLVARLGCKLRLRGRKIAIVAIDPSSPYSGGAILGDRIRMSEMALDNCVFIRSMATRGAVGGMAHAALDAVDILDVAGFDTIIVETVGVGQDEVEIAQASHTTVVVSAPGLGDGIQAIKAGMLEIADLHVVSKCDRADANRTLTDLKMMLKDGLHANPRDGWRAPVIGTSSYDDQGFDELVEALDTHRRSLSGAAGVSRQTRITVFRIAKAAETLVLERFRSSNNIMEYAPNVAARKSDPYTVARALVQRFASEVPDV